LKFAGSVMKKISGYVTIVWKNEMAKHTFGFEDFSCDVVSESNADKSYHVVFLMGGVWRCDCPSFKFRGKAKKSGCKHIRAVRDGEIYESALYKREVLGE
jgi:hypothetical protein